MGSVRAHVRFCAEVMERGRGDKREREEGQRGSGLKKRIGKPHGEKWGEFLSLYPCLDSLAGPFEEPEILALAHHRQRFRLCQVFTQLSAAAWLRATACCFFKFL